MFLYLIKGQINIDDINIETAKTIARWIKERHPAVMILYIIGSVLRPDLIHSGSDIDIVIRGIKEADYEVLIKNVYHKFSPLRVDIRRMEELDSYMKQKILAKGYRVWDEREARRIKK